MEKKKILDMRSIVFVVAGILWALFSVWLDRGWYWWLLGALVAAAVLRIAIGPRVRVIAFSAGAVTTIFVTFFYLFGYPVYDDLRHRTAFDEAGWKANETGEDIMWPPRLRMVDDLLATRDLRGWDRSRVVKLLGKPDMTNWNREGQMVYLLGPERGLFSVDSEWLVITLDDKGKVAGCMLARD
jgi:hypothetical protein